MPRLRDLDRDEDLVGFNDYPMVPYQPPPEYVNYNVPEYRVDVHNSDIPILGDFGKGVRWVGDHVSKPIMKWLEGDKFNEQLFNNFNNSVANLASGDVTAPFQFGETVWNSPLGKRTRDWATKEYNRITGPFREPLKIEQGPGPSTKRYRTKGEDRVTIRNNPGMKRKYAIRTTGIYGGRFRGRKKTKVSSAAYHGCVLKSEQNGTLSDPTAVYVGHVASPVYQTLRCIGWSIARLVAKYWRQDFGSFYAPINGPDKTSVVSLRVTLSIRTSQTGVISDFTWTDTSSSWAELGDNIMHHIIANCTASLVFYEIVRIKFANIDATAVESLQTIILHGDNLKIAVNGFSKMKVQNNTVSTSGDIASNEQADDIANNPLVGKQYFGKGHYHSYRYNNDYTTSTPTFYYTTGKGYLTMTPATATSMETSVLNFLNKVPPHKAWTNMSGYRNVKLGPGEIKTSVVSSKYKFSLNRWIKVLFPAIRHMSNLSTADSNTTFVNISRNSIIGLEHMLHGGTEPDISISYQIDTTTTGIATHKKKMYCVPDFQTATHTLIVDEDPEQS